jgi:hypothetical protein
MEGESGDDFVCPSIRELVRNAAGKGLAQEYRERGHDAELGLSYEICVRHAAGSRVDAPAVAAFAVAALAWVGRLHWSAPVPRLSVGLWLTPLRKTWAAADCADLGPCEVNSGDTTLHADGSRDIRVWRAEDWSLVLLHELFHAFNWDRLVSRPVRAAGPERGHGRHVIPASFANPSEALVDAMALVAHCQFLAPPDTDSPRGQRTEPDGWGRLFREEQAWTRRQAGQLMQCAWRSRGTSVFSYYVLKAALLHAPALLASWLRQGSAAELRRSWPELVETALAGFYRLVEDPVAVDSAIPMSRARHRLSTEPAPSPASSPTLPGLAGPPGPASGGRGAETGRRLRRGAARGFSFLSAADARSGGVRTVQG